jgi:hypothetical protein
VALAAPRDGIAKIDRAAVVLERAVVDRFGDRDVLVATKDGRLVVLVPGGSPELRPGVPAKDVGGADTRSSSPHPIPTFQCHQFDGGSLAGKDCLPHSSTRSLKSRPPAADAATADAERRGSMSAGKPAPWTSLETSAG